MDLDPGLGALRPLGGFFVLRTSLDVPRAGTALARAYADGDPLDLRVRHVARVLRTGEDRVAASVAQQGLAARLWSVTLGCAALYGSVPDLDPELLHWDPGAAAPDDLWLGEVRARRADPGTVADVVLHGHLEPLAGALGRRHRVAHGLLWGNAGSALVAAARQLDGWARAHGRSDAAARARDLTARLLAHPLLAGTGTLTGTAFRRRSCCLYYRVPGGGLCGDCCLTRPPRSSPHAPSG
ncbi:(2Fe-2S)-binding protein [Streptomyces sp. NPDC056628]|uniref:(2Fe-2S)-binding protein n=1 Tax=Streptomyces sp. NPDC056628 TaxID=3345882 RepID=UPI00367D1519